MNFLFFHSADVSKIIMLKLSTYTFRRVLKLCLFCLPETFRLNHLLSDSEDSDVTECKNSVRAV